MSSFLYPCEEPLKVVESRPNSPRGSLNHYLDPDNELVDLFQKLWAIVERTFGVLA